MFIYKVSYIENGYFNVKYSTNTVVQDIEGIKMTDSTNEAIKPLLLFLRTLKLEKLQKGQKYNDFDYRDKIVYEKAIDENNLNIIFNNAFY